MSCVYGLLRVNVKIGTVQKKRSSSEDKHSEVTMRQFIKKKKIYQKRNSYLTQTSLTDPLYDASDLDKSQ